MSERMTEQAAFLAWHEFPFRGDGSAWAEPVAAEFWRARASEGAKDEQIALLRTAMVRAAAELRHAYGNHAQGYALDSELVSRAICLLEEAVSRNP